ncbi:BON domain-containing protein [Endozoicomonas sp.]|nr:BON domain-containing protein [Endozoicomonas sp.]
MTRINGFILAAFVMLISGCSTIVGSVNDGPVEINPNERTWGQWMDDQAIETVAAVNIKKADPAFKKSRIKAVSFNGTLLLIGQVPDARLKELAQTTANDITQITQVYNELTVEPIANLLTQSNDVLLTTKIKTGLISSKKVIADHIKINTENGTVFLMGLVTPESAEAAVDVARNTSGVKKVVKVFEYLP